METDFTHQIYVGGEWLVASYTGDEFKFKDRSEIHRCYITKETGYRFWKLPSEVRIINEQ